MKSMSHMRASLAMYVYLFGTGAVLSLSLVACRLPDTKKVPRLRDLTDDRCRLLVQVTWLYSPVSCTCFAKNLKYIQIMRMLVYQASDKVSFNISIEVSTLWSSTDKYTIRALCTSSLHLGLFFFSHL